METKVNGKSSYYFLQIAASDNRPAASSGTSSPRPIVHWSFDDWMGGKTTVDSAYHGYHAVPNAYKVVCDFGQCLGLTEQMEIPESAVEHAGMLPAPANLLKKLGRVPEVGRRCKLTVFL